MVAEPNVVRGAVAPRAVVSAALAEATVHFVADHGWKLLPHYRFEPRTGLWRHHGWGERGVRSLKDVSYAAGRLTFRRRHATEPEAVLPGYLDEAREIVARVEAAPPADAGDDPALDPEVEALRWFPLPGEALRDLRRTSR